MNKNNAHSHSIQTMSILGCIINNITLYIDNQFCYKCVTYFQIYNVFYCAYLHVHIIMEKCTRN